MGQLGRVDDRNIVTRYSGNASRTRESFSADAANMCISVVDSEGQEREIYRGLEFVDFDSVAQERADAVAAFMAQCAKRPCANEEANGLEACGQCRDAALAQYGSP